MGTSMAQFMKNQPLNYPSGVIVLLVWCTVSVALATGTTAETPAGETEARVLSEPIHITADRLVTHIAAQSAQFSGSVLAVQGETRIRADKLTVHYQSNGSTSANGGSGAIQRISAQGHVNITFDNRLAVSEQAVYITSERKLIIEGPGSKVTSGQNEIVGSKITYYRDDGRVTVEGDGQNRVKATFHSEQKDLN